MTYLAASATVRRADAIDAIIAPHAGMMFSGPVAAYAYRLLQRSRPFDVAVLVGPSHFVGFDGVALYPSGGFETPSRRRRSTTRCGARSAARPRRSSSEHAGRASRANTRSRCSCRFSGGSRRTLPIVPLVMGYQTARRRSRLGEALAAALAAARALLVASTDLSHYHDAATAGALDAVVHRCVARFDADGLLRCSSSIRKREPDARRLRRRPTVAVMRRRARSARARRAC